MAISSFKILCSCISSLSAYFVLYKSLDCVWANCVILRSCFMRASGSVQSVLTLLPYSSVISIGLTMDISSSIVVEVLVCWSSFPSVRIENDVSLLSYSSSKSFSESYIAPTTEVSSIDGTFPYIPEANGSSFSSPTSYRRLFRCSANELDPLSTATSMAVIPSLLVLKDNSYAFGEKREAIDSSPLAAARCITVLPSLSRWSADAPCANSNAAQS
mmetsp:Transcript_5422/g.13576  ORF Transcript_5422/g.13576 Transcript_5422/m.13576 type:complete len:216 (-) Transcript_5422:233-880(-)